MRKDGNVYIIGFLSPYNIVSDLLVGKENQPGGGETVYIEDISLHHDNTSWYVEVVVWDGQAPAETVLETIRNGNDN